MSQALNRRLQGCLPLTFPSQCLHPHAGQGCSPPPNLGRSTVPKLSKYSAQRWGQHTPVNPALNWKEHFSGIVLSPDLTLQPPKAHALAPSCVKDLTNWSYIDSENAPAVRPDASQTAKHWCDCNFTSSARGLLFLQRTSCLGLVKSTSLEEDYDANISSTLRNINASGEWELQVLW